MTEECVNATHKKGKKYFKKTKNLHLYSLRLLRVLDHTLRKHSQTKTAKYERVSFFSILREPEVEGTKT